MRKSLLFGSSLVGTLAFAFPAGAVTMYVSPTGTGTDPACCSARDTPCSLATGASAAVAGDTVILMDGVYQGHGFRLDHLQGG